MTEVKSSDNLFAGIKGTTTANAAAPAPVAPATPAPVAAPEVEDDEPAAPQVSQLDMLKQRARVMGIQFSNNIGLDALKAKIQAKLDGEAESQEEAPAEPAVSAATGPKIKSHRQQMRDEYMRLIRVRITNLDPKKKDLPGEIFTFANEVLGAVRKYIPYGEVTDNGYHIPYCIFLQLEDRKFLNIKVRKDNRGREIVESNWVREFALEVLPPLTEVELARLAASQAAAGGVE